MPWMWTTIMELKEEEKMMKRNTTKKKEYKLEKEEKPLKSKKSTTKSKWYFDIDAINSQHEIREKKLRPYKCKLCNKTFTVKGDMNKHVLFVHEGIKYPCRACPREFPTSS